MSVTPNMIANEKRFEGNIPYMYLDTAGNVTVGVGKLLSNVNAATTLPFLKKSDATAASTANITTEFGTVQGLEVGHVASYYDQFTTLRLKQPDIDSLLTTDLNGFEQQLATNFSEYDNFPASAQEGLVDMVFNLGIGSLINSFPTFTAAVRAKDWNKAAAECHRQDISDERNDFVKELFQKAAAS
jgi:GH24 family phage-related lysozyme (muramidase)